MSDVLESVVYGITLKELKPLRLQRYKKIRIYTNIFLLFFQKSRNIHIICIYRYVYDTILDRHWTDVAPRMD